MVPEEDEGPLMPYGLDTLALDAGLAAPMPPMALLPPEATDEDVAAYVGLGTHGERKALLDEQRMRAQALRGEDYGGHSTGIGAALGGLGGIINNVRGGMELKRLDKETLRLLGDEDARRARFATTLRGADASQVANLGMLSGDRQLGAFGQQVSKEQMARAPMTFRGEALRQAAERLKLLRQESARRSAQGKDKFDLDKYRVEAGVNQGWKGLGLRQQELEAQAAERERKRQERTQDDETGMRREFMSNPVAKSYFEAEVGYNKMQAAARDPSAAGDISLIFGFMKTMDPGSTVREGEFASAQNAAGVPERVRAMANSLINGQRLTPEQRADFMRTAEGQFGAYRNAYQGLVRSYQGLAGQTGASPDRVVLPRSAPDTDLNQPPGASSLRTTGRKPDANQQVILDFISANPSHPRAEEARQRLRREGIIQ